MRRPLAAAAAAAAALALAACGGDTQHASASAAPPHTTSTTPATAASTTAPAVSVHTTPVPPKPPPFPPYPQLLPAALGSGSAIAAPAMRWHGRTAAWISRLPSGAALMIFDPHHTELHLHSGTIDAGTLGWRYGPSVGGFERARLIAAFNGGFRLNTGAGGFASYGREAAPLQPGRASIVSYSDGTSDIGSWDQEVPASGKHVVSVRQNLTLLIDHGVPASNLDCLDCWGATLGGVAAPARSAIGITAEGRLVWAGGSGLTVSELASALLSVHVVRAAELDINPEWVAGYLYGHRGGHGPLAPVPALHTQTGIPGQYLAPWSRDFFSVTAR